MSSYDARILDILASAPRPLGHRDLVDLIDPDNNVAFTNIGLALTRLHRFGILTRKRVRRDATKRQWYVYRIQEPPS